MPNRFDNNNESINTGNFRNKKKKYKKGNDKIKSKPKMIHRTFEIPINLKPLQYNLEKNTIQEKSKIIEIPEVKLNNLDDLISLAKMARDKDASDEKYPSKIQKLSLILEPLEELKGLVGLDKIKDKVVEQIIYLVSHSDDKYPPMFHTCIEGNPGTGKTHLARILGKIIYRIGYLKRFINEKPKKGDNMMEQLSKMLNNAIVIDITSNQKHAKLEHNENKKTDEKKDIIKYVTRTDLVAGYLGQTAIKTQKAIDEATGGVLIIDEAYSLGGNRSNGDTDSYSQEAIDTLVSNLSENRSFMCIILGYPGELESGFFSKNRGLTSRFPFRYSIDKYSNEELGEILKRKIEQESYLVNKDEIITILNSNKEKDLFKNLGRDMEVLWLKIKMEHTKRVYLQKTNMDIIKEDLKNGLDKFTSEKKKRESNPSHMFMYL